MRTICLATHVKLIKRLVSFFEFHLVVDISKPLFFYACPLTAKYFLLTRSVFPRLTKYKTPYNILKQYGLLNNLFCANVTSGSQMNVVTSSITQTVPHSSQFYSKSVFQDARIVVLDMTETKIKCYVSPPITIDIQLSQVNILPCNTHCDYESRISSCKNVILIYIYIAYGSLV